MFGQNEKNIYLKAIISCKPIRDALGKIYPIIITLESSIFSTWIKFVALYDKKAIFKAVRHQNTVCPWHTGKILFAEILAWGIIFQKHYTEKNTKFYRCINWGTLKLTFLVSDVQMAFWEYISPSINISDI